MTKQIPTSPFPRGVSNPATRALIAAGYAKLSDLAGVNESALLKLHGVGPKAIGPIQKALAEARLPPLQP